MVLLGAAVPRRGCRRAGIRRPQLRHRRPQPAAARRPRHPGLPDLRRAFGSLDQLYVVFTAPDGHDDLRVRATRSTRGWTRCAQRRRSRASTPGIVDRDARSSAGSPTGSCCCCRRAQPRRGARALPAATACASRCASGARCWPCRRRRSRSWSARIRSACSTCCATQLGGAQAGVNLGVTEGGYVTPDGRSRLRDRAAGAGRRTTPTSRAR